MTLSGAATPQMQALHAGEQLAIPVRAGAELFCASGAVHVQAASFSGLAMPLSLDLAAGRGWRCVESTRVLVTAHAPSRVIVHEPQRPAGNIAARGFPQLPWWRLARTRRAA